MTPTIRPALAMILTIATLCLMTVFPGPLAAGSSMGGPPNHPEAEVAQFADRVQTTLAAQGAHVAIVARSGRNPARLPEGIRYTHVAYWVYSQITHPDGTTGTGYRVYNLYQTPEDRARSALVQDSPTEFFTPAWRMDAGIIIPDVRLQEKLLATIASPDYARLHNPHYALLSNPRTTQFQNCTEHTLDVLMASLYGTSDKARIKANIAAHFDPQPIEVGGAKRALAAMASRAMTTRDHGDTVATTTFGSLARFMQTHGLTQQVLRLDAQGVRAF